MMVVGDNTRRLAETVDQPRNLRRDERIGERIGGGDGAGQPILAMGLGQHGDDADGRHGDRHAGDKAGGGETLGAARAEYLAIGIGHRQRPRHLQARLNMTYIRYVCE